MEVQVTKLSTQGFSRQRFRRVGCYGRGKLIDSPYRGGAFNPPGL